MRSSRNFRPSQTITVIFNLFIFGLLIIGFLNAFHHNTEVAGVIFLVLIILFPSLSIMGVLFPKISILWWTTFVMNSIFAITAGMIFIYFVIDRVMNPPVGVDISGGASFVSFFMIVASSINIFTLLVNKHVSRHRGKDVKEN